MRRALLIVPVILVLVGAGYALARAHTVPAPPVDMSSDMVKQRAYWQARVEAVGPEKAYEEFSKAFDDGPPYAHTIAHILGDLMYDKIGVKALSVCDDTSGFGCFHQVIGDAISETGGSAIEEIDTLCGEQGASTRGHCYHGLGHGVFEYYGAAHLSDALDACSYIAGAGDCRAGVFMQYNAPIMTDGRETLQHLRPFDATLPYFPCDTDMIKQEHKSDCFVSLSNWWMKSGVETTVVANLCHGLADDIVDSCVWGISVTLPGSLSFDQEKVIGECETISDAHDRRTCLKSSAQMLDDFKKDSCIIRRFLGENVPQCKGV